MEKAKDYYPEINEETPEILKNYINAKKEGTKSEVTKSSKKLEKYILSKVKDVVKRFYDNDFSLLNDGMSEWTVTGRLAMYLQNEFEDFTGYFVDIEYYRLKVPRDRVSDIRTQRIRCDILLHTRGKYNHNVDNLLAMEIKLEDNVDDGESDMSRLAEFVLPDPSNEHNNVVHSTLVGLFLRLGKKGYSSCQLKSNGYKEIKVQSKQKTKQKTT